MKRSGVKTKKSNLPSPVITRYMAEKLLFEEVRRQKDLRGEALKNNSDYQNLKVRKQKALVKLFESMGNLIFFFEAINQNDVLDEEFRTAAQELLGLIRNKSDKSPMLRLLDAMFMHSLSEDVSDDYRVVLAQQIHKTTAGFFRKMNLSYNIDTADSMGDLGAYAKIIDQDLARGEAWTNSFARMVRTRLPDRAPWNTLEIPELAEVMNEVKASQA